MKLNKLWFVLGLFVIMSCNTNTEKEQTEVVAVSTKNKSGDFSEMSIYNLPSHWTNQNGEEVVFKDFKGKVLVTVMIYTSCKIACPRLVADMRNIKKQLSEDVLKNVEMILVSIDPETDTPDRLKAFAKENLMDESPWTFLRSTEANTREFAAVLAVNYTEISPIEFSHSNIISVFNEQGELIFQQEGLNVNSDATVKYIREAVTEMY